MMPREAVWHAAATLTQTHLSSNVRTAISQPSSQVNSAKNSSTISFCRKCRAWNWSNALNSFVTYPVIRAVFVAASHQTRLDTRSKARRPIKVGIKGRGRSGTSRDSNPACLCCSSAHLVQCEPDEASSFTNPNVGPGTYASLRLKLDAWSSAVQGVQRRQKYSSPTRR